MHTDADGAVLDRQHIRQLGSAYHSHAHHISSNMRSYIAAHLSLSGQDQTCSCVLVNILILCASYT